MTPQLARQVRMRDAQPQHEPTVGRLGERHRRHSRGLGIVAPDTDDARAQPHPARLAGEKAEGSEWLPAYRLRHPEGAVAELLHATGVRAQPRDGQAVEVPPDADLAELNHRPMPARSGSEGTVRSRNGAPR